MERHNTEQRNYFERLVKPTMVPGETPYIRNQVDAMIAFAELSPNDRVLEVGCGMGRYTLPLHASGIRVEGLDLSPVLLERLRGFAGDDDITLHAADVFAPPTELLEKFDAVIGFFALHHFHDLDRCFGSMAKLVKPGGRVVFLEPNAFNPLYYIQVTISPTMSWEGDRGIINMRRGRVFRAMTSAGLERLSIHRFGFFPPAIANLSGARGIERTLERLPFIEPILPFQLFRGVRPTVTEAINS
jgi:SAM-dependent methyltransferase